MLWTCFSQQKNLTSQLLKMHVASGKKKNSGSYNYKKAPFQIEFLRNVWSETHQARKWGLWSWIHDISRLNRTQPILEATGNIIVYSSVLLRLQWTQLSTPQKSNRKKGSKQDTSKSTHEFHQNPRSWLSIGVPMSTDGSHGETQPPGVRNGPP